MQKMKVGLAESEGEKEKLSKKLTDLAAAASSSDGTSGAAVAEMAQQLQELAEATSELNEEKEALSAEMAEKETELDSLRLKAKKDAEETAKKVKQLKKTVEEVKAKEAKAESEAVAAAETAAAADSTAATLAVLDRDISTGLSPQDQKKYQVLLDDSVIGGPKAAANFLDSKLGLKPSAESEEDPRLGRDIRIWLAQAHENGSLMQYTKLFIEAGYDDLDLLKDADVDNLKELFATCEDEFGVKVKPPHQKRILKAFEDLAAQDQVEPAVDDAEEQAQKEAVHAEEVAKLNAEHSDALAGKEEEHTLVVAAKEAEHEAAVKAKDEAHSAAIAATVDAQGSDALVVLTSAVAAKEAEHTAAMEAQAAAHADESIRILGEYKLGKGLPGDSVEAEAAQRESLDMQIVELKKQLKNKEGSINELSSDKRKLENYIKKTLAAVQAKYMLMIETHKDQIKEKDAKIGRLERRLKEDRAAQKREEDLVVSAFYEVGIELQRRMMVSGGTESSASWAGRMRTAQSNNRSKMAYHKDHIKEKEAAHAEEVPKLNAEHSDALAGKEEEREEDAAQSAQDAQDALQEAPPPAPEAVDLDESHVRLTMDEGMEDWEQIAVLQEEVNAERGNAERGNADGRQYTHRTMQLC
jgi:hypothetical protein